MTSSARQEFVENAGVFFERLGFSRTAGRVLGWLLTASEGSADAPELCAELSVAKSSMSVALRQLENSRLIERYRPPGERRFRFRVDDDIFGRAFHARMADFDALTELITRGLDVVGDDPEPRARLQTMAEMYAFMGREFPKLLARWDESKRRQE